MQVTKRELQMETMFLGVSLFDRFLSLGYFKDMKNIQIAGIACLSLATRIEENQPYNWFQLILSSQEKDNYEQAALMQEYKRQIDRESRWSANGSHGSPNGDGIQAIGRSSHKMIDVVMQSAAKGKVVDADAVIGNVSSLAKKIQSVFMQEVLFEGHFALRTVLHEVYPFLCEVY